MLRALARPLARTARHYLNDDNAHHLSVCERLPVFTTNSTCSNEERAQFALNAANQAFPLLLGLLDKSPKPVTVEKFANSSADILGRLLTKHGSDKATKHNYHLLYAHILNPKTTTSLLEIGLGTNNTDVPSHMGEGGSPGASLRAFRDYLPGAEIYGADIDERILFQEPRIKTFKVDQTEPASLGRIVSGPFDLIIDDGLHAPHANLATLGFALRKLKPNGWVVIEDITPRALPIWQVVDRLLRDSFTTYLIEARGALMFAATNSQTLTAEFERTTWRRN
jgi:SAM-dependent methyltransferase